MEQTTTAHTYQAYATMRNGVARQVEVTAADAVEARRRMFALNRAIASLTMPQVLGATVPRVEYMRRASDGVAA